MTSSTTSSTPAAAPALVPALPPRLPVSRQTLFDAASLSLPAVRIPALLRGEDGRLTAFAEARHDGAGDSGRIEVLATTSADGRTWSEPIVVARLGAGTMGNPVPLEAANGDTVLLTTSNGAAITEAEILAGTASPEDGRRVHVTRMTADLSRIEPTVEITDQVRRPDWRWYATGPGHGVRLPSGRLVVAANHSRAGGSPAGAASLDGSPASSCYGAHGLISDDDGATWQIAWVTDGAPGASAPNESALTPDPSDADEVVVTMRNEQPGEPATRLMGRTSGGCAELVAQHGLGGFVGPRLQAGITALPDTDGQLLTAPLHVSARRDLVLHAVEGASCRPVGLLVPGPAGYSDLALGADPASGEGAVHVLVETGDARTHERIELVTIDLPTALHAVGPLKEQHP